MQSLPRHAVSRGAGYVPLLGMRRNDGIKDQSSLTPLIFNFRLHGFGLFGGVWENGMQQFPDILDDYDICRDHDQGDGCREQDAEAKGDPHGYQELRLD